MLSSNSSLEDGEYKGADKCLEEVGGGKKYLLSSIFIWVLEFDFEFFMKSCSLIKKVKLWKFKLDELRRNMVKH